VSCLAARVYVETFEQIVSIASGAVGLIAGLATILMKSRAKALPGQSRPGAKLTSYRDESALAKRRQVPRTRSVALLGASAMLVPAPILLWGGDLNGLFWLSGSAMYFYMAHAAGRAHSRTFKTATVVVESPVEEVMHRCHEVLRDLGHRIIAFDLAEGVIEASGKPTMLAQGQVVTVLVEASGQPQTRVVIESDLRWTTMWLDFGANQRNVDRFVAGLLGY